MEEAAAAGDLCAVKAALESVILHHDEKMPLLLRICPGAAAVIQRSLLAAVRGAHPDVLRLLLSAGASPSDEVIQVAAASGACDALDVFYQHGLDVNKADPDGRTPLHYALRSLSAMRWLLEHGAAPNTHDASVPMSSSQERPPIVTAAWGHSPAVVQLLLQYGADPRTECLLHAAVTATNPDLLETYPRQDPDRVEVLRILLEAGADVNDMEPDPKSRPMGGALRRQRNMEDGIPLHAAVNAGNIRTVRFLLEHGADPQAPSWSGHKALDLALRNKYEDVIALLIDWECSKIEKASPADKTN